MASVLDILPKAPSETLTQEKRREIAEISTQLEAEQATQPFAGVALNRLKAVTSRSQLVLEIQRIQDEREFATLSESLRGRLSLLQKSVETLSEQGSRIIEQSVVQPVNEKIQELPSWARLSILGLGVGSTLYTGYKVGKSVVGGIGKFLSKTWKYIAGAAVAGLGALGIHHFMKSQQTPAESTEAAPT